MWDHNCGCVPVADENLKVLGILTDRDICMAAYTRGLPLSDLCVAEAMSKDVACCRPGDEISRAERLMAERQVRRLPVVTDDGRLLGVLSVNDLAREATRERPLSKKSVGTDEVIATLAATCQPRPGTALAAA